MPGEAKPEVRRSARGSRGCGCGRAVKSSQIRDVDLRLKVTTDYGVTLGGFRVLFGLKAVIYSPWGRLCYTA